VNALFCRLLICILILQQPPLQEPTTKQEIFHHLPTQDAMAFPILTTGQVPPPTTDRVRLPTIDQVPLPTTDRVRLPTIDQAVHCLTIEFRQVRNSEVQNLTRQRK
jgi:hypothetical protein